MRRPDESPLERALKVAFELGNPEGQVRSAQSVLFEVRHNLERARQEICAATGATVPPWLAELEHKTRERSVATWSLLEDLFGLRYDVLEVYEPPASAPPRAHA